MRLHLLSDPWEVRPDGPAASNSDATASRCGQMTKNVQVRRRAARTAVVAKPRVKKADRRVVRTRRQLREALVSLVNERGWDAVTVKDVCDRANIGRSTLYLHFADKEDLLFSGFQDLEATLEDARAAAPGQFAFARGLIAHAQSELPMFRALAARRPGRHVVSHLRGVSVRLVSAELEYLRIPRSQRPLLAPYIAGALVELIVGWLERPTRQSAEEMASGFIALTRGLVASAT
jgi:AcrR family transcriptional regulator